MHCSMILQEKGLTRFKDSTREGGGKRDEIPRIQTDNQLTG